MRSLTKRFASSFFIPTSYLPSSSFLFPHCLLLTIGSSDLISTWLRVHLCFAICDLVLDDGVFGVGVGAGTVGQRYPWAYGYGYGYSLAELDCMYRVAYLLRLGARYHNHGSNLRIRKFDGVDVMML